MRTNSVLFGFASAVACASILTAACSSDSGGGAGGSPAAAGGSAGTGAALVTGGGGGTAGAGGTVVTGGSAGTSGAGGTSGSGGTTVPAGPGPTISGCPVFPADNPWNLDVSGDLVDPNSDAIVANINSSGGTTVHPDFGATLEYGIPYVVVPGTQPKVPMTFDYASDSDPGPYPIPPDAPIEGGAASTGDRHILVIDKDNCMLWETWDSHFTNPGWQCGSGAKFDLRSNALRTDCWTSADAAGLPVFPGLVRYDEAVTAGKIEHALRFTVSKTRQAFIHPATHYASSNTGATFPPMGMRMRLKASYNTSTFTGAAKVILTALAKYGMILADNGSNWYISGASNAAFDDNNLNTLKTVPGTAFEVVQMGKIYLPADCP
jgi:hypothetical protein